MPTTYGQDGQQEKPATQDRVRSPEQAVEDGVALIAEGLFRLNEKEGPASAAATAGAVVSTMRGVMLDLMRQMEAGR